MTIYHSESGRQVLQSVYNDALNQLDIDVETEVMSTEFGDTNILLAGPSDSEPIILFHGGNATNPLTLSWYQGLAKSYRLIAPDTIGQPGYSSEQRVDPFSDDYGRWVSEILDNFGITSADMIGTSYGGGIILRLAAFDPSRIDGASLVVPAGFGTGSMIQLMSIGVPSILYRFIDSPRLLNIVINRMVTDVDANSTVQETIGASLKHVKLERTFPSATEEELRGFSTPVAVFVAENDPFFPPEQVISTANQLLPNLVHSEILREEKHMLSNSQQRAVVKQIEELIQCEYQLQR